MAEPDPHPDTALRRTPLYDLHLAHGARLVPFAGYEMPVQFEGVKAEHLWTRAHAGLFDVSHMGPCLVHLPEDSPLEGEAAHLAIAAILEELVPSDLAGLKPGQARLTVLLDETGGILDDLIVTRPDADKDQGALYVVVNGATKQADWARMRERFAGRAGLLPLDEGHVLFALQGPEAEAVAREHFPGNGDRAFMTGHLVIEPRGVGAISRCGYTGEDGFELLMPEAAGAETVERLLADPRVKPIGLGARDSLRLEAGLCLYGHDLDPSRNPVEAGLAWVIQKSRRDRADFPGAGPILRALAEGPAMRRVGIRPTDRAPAREGTEIFVGDQQVGTVTSGGFGPSVDGPIAMGYVYAAHATPGTALDLMVRGKRRAANIVPLPFVPHRYKR